MGRTIAIALIRLYRRIASPWSRGACRYWPSCSAYAEEAFERHGLVRGAYLATMRVLKCHPLGGHGVDPVP